MECWGWGSLPPWRSGMPGWEQLGWQPDGRVRCVYTARVSSDRSRTVLESRCDLNADGKIAHFLYTIGGPNMPGLLDVHPRRD